MANWYGSNDDDMFGGSGYPSRQRFAEERKPKKGVYFMISRNHYFNNHIESVIKVINNVTHDFGLRDGMAVAMYGEDSDDTFSVIEANYIEQIRNKNDKLDEMYSSTMRSCTSANVLEAIKYARIGIRNWDIDYKTIVVFIDEYTPMSGGSELMEYCKEDHIKVIFVVIDDDMSSRSLDIYNSYASKCCGAVVTPNDCNDYVNGASYAIRNALIMSADEYKPSNYKKGKTNQNENKPEVQKAQAVEEDTTMNFNKIFGGEMKIGQVQGDQFKGSFAGSAMKTKSGYVTWDGESFTDVTDFTFDGDFAFALPTFQVKVGDIILKDGTPVFVEEVISKDRIKIINPETSIAEEYLPKKTIFGFRMYIKIWSLFANIMPKGMMSGFNPNNPAATPMESIMPMMMLSGLFGGDNKQDDGMGGLGMLFMLPALMGGEMGGMFNFGGTDETDSENPMGNMMQMIMPMMFLQQMMGKDNKNGNGNDMFSKMMPLMMMPQIMKAIGAPVEKKAPAKKGSSKGKAGAAQTPAAE